MIFIPTLIGVGVAIGAVATIKAASQVPRGPFSKEERVSPYYNPQVQQSLRRTAIFAHFSRRQNQVTQGQPEMVDSTGMTLSQQEAWNRSLERVRAYNRSR